MSARTYRSRLPAAFLLVFGITAVLALGERRLAEVRSRMTAPTHGATWIWEPRNKRDISPTAFYALRDFTLERVPKNARLLVLADEEYVLTLNAKRIGVGRYRDGAPLDAYEVAPWLLPGGNRLVVELRSGRGAGGLLLSLEDRETGRPIVESGPGFRIARRHQLGLVRGLVPVGGAPEAFSWGLPPLGRWGWPRTDGITATLPAQMHGGPLPAVTTRETAPLAVLFDWGHEVDGYLELLLPEPGETSETSRVEAGLLWVGTAPPDLAGRPSGAILPLPEARAWLAAEPRRLRYALVAGLARGTGGEGIAARILPVAASAVPAASPAPRGIFGIEPPPLRTPVEDEVRRKLERVARLALGEKP